MMLRGIFDFAWNLYGQKIFARTVLRNICYLNLVFLWIKFIIYFNKNSTNSQFVNAISQIVNVKITLRQNKRHENRTFLLIILS
jgi:hypothetical protein